MWCVLGDFDLIVFICLFVQLNKFIFIVNFVSFDVIKKIVCFGFELQVSFKNVFFNFGNIFDGSICFIGCKVIYCLLSK